MSGMKKSSQFMSSLEASRPPTARVRAATPPDFAVDGLKITKVL